MSINSITERIRTELTELRRIWNNVTDRQRLLNLLIPTEDHERFRTSSVSQIIDEFIRHHNTNNTQHQINNDGTVRPPTTIPPTTTPPTRPPIE